MAKADLTNTKGVTDKRNSTAANAVSSTTVLGVPLNYDDITKLRARLTAINAGRYTSAYLDILTKNDMIYALRTLDDPTGI
jgi:xanthine dehydrogenase molybdopterin-binding subunit B